VASFDPWLPLDEETAWAPQPVWTQRLEENPFVPARDQTLVVQSVDNHYIDEGKLAQEDAVLGDWQSRTA
jgi:hypothetical protein